MPRSHLPLVSIAALCCVTAAPAVAQTSTGSGWAFLCSDGQPPAANGSCRRGGAGGGSQPASTNPAANPAERNAEIERARQKLGLQRRAQADSRMRQAAEAANQRRIEGERQAQFQRERNASVQGLKGVSRDIGLRDAVRDTPPSRPISPSSALRPSQRMALQQAACGLGVLRDALESAESASDLASALGQASFIMDGSRPPAKKCAEPPQWEIPPGTDVELVVARARAITTRAQGLLQAPEPDRPGRPLTADERRIQAAFRAQRENEQRYRDRDAPVIQAQERINRVQKRKFDPRDANAIAREQRTKAELRPYVNAIEKLEQGKIEEFLDLTAGVDGILSGSAAPNKP